MGEEYKYILLETQGGANLPKHKTLRVHMFVRSHNIDCCLDFGCHPRLSKKSPTQIRKIALG
jgi:hypothetical protein